ncbi:MAG: DUF3667 domain-containing protein [Bacteroidales bacterium]|nr:DUF3667 domain-containing protein [Bacteroidales bacterium]
MKQINSNICPNCENSFQENYEYCPHCGQKKTNQQLKLKDFIGDFISATFNLESKLLLTLKYLFIKPNFLAKEFLAGKRTKYIPPVRLFVFINFVYFLILFWNTTIFINPNSDNPINTEMDSLINYNVGLETIDNNNTSNNLFEKDSTEEINKIEEYLETKFNLFSTDTGYLKFKQNFKKYISSGLFVLLPIIALIFYLLFYKNSNYITHLIFILYLQSAILIYSSAFRVLEFFITIDKLLSIEILILVILSVVWIKNFYEISLKKTIWKLMLFYTIYAILMSVYIIIILLFSIILL